MRIKVSIADDHPLIINGLSNMLQNSDEVEIIATYRNGSELMDGLDTTIPDVLLLDIQMPDKSGPELARIITQKYPTIRMLALTNLDNDFYIKTMFRNGALGYILKNSEKEILLEAIRTVYIGNQFLEQQFKDRIWQKATKSRGNGTSIPPLTRREKEILNLIVNEYTTNQIADKLFISISTIETHRLNLLSKLDVKNSVGLVKKAILLGLID